MKDKSWKTELMQTTGEEHMSNKKFGTETWDKYSMVDYDNALKCYHCGGENLHHRDVSVFFREEDADVGLMVYASPNMTHVAYKEPQADNPSARRDGITINMWCEFCTKWSYYHIVQHKGFTIPFMTGSRAGESE